MLLCAEVRGRAAAGWVQELAGLFVKVAQQREASQHSIMVGHQDLGALVASALGALKLQARPLTHSHSLSSRRAPPERYPHTLLHPNPGQVGCAPAQRRA